MKRYWVFAGSNYYPPKGMVGFRGSFNHLDDAQLLLKSCKENDHDWGHIFDAEESLIVEAYDQVTNDIIEKLPQAIKNVWSNLLDSPEWDSDLYEARKLLDNDGNFE